MCAETYTCVGGIVAVMLSWVTDSDTAAAALQKKELIGPESLKPTLQQGLRDDAVDTGLIDEFFTLPGRRALHNKLSRLYKDAWLCLSLIHI